MQTVYRIEHHKTKEGMYRCMNRGFYSFLGGLDRDNDRHPGPGSDSLLVSNITNAGKDEWRVFRELHYAFASIDQLRNWVYNDEWLAKLSKNGYVLAEYRSDEVYVGNTQAVFKRPTRRHRKHNIIKYFKLNQGETK